MDKWFDFFALAFAVLAVTDIWLLSDLFADRRAELEQTAELYAERRTQSEQVWSRMDHVHFFFARMLTCRLCLSIHVTVGLGLLFYVPAFLLREHDIAELCKYPVYALGAVGLLYFLHAWKTFATEGRQV